ncbi:hypothetical protein GGX14DRAFT_387909 [Mycena pura]|uniref:Uncharacterized protein n=1 Tax=Mycena pura TaxID=153505 RepID=A0AAD6YMF1_9AGAR|nr:hypothetical protein GGX14DRAFT_387909 [Mycena pura]
MARSGSSPVRSFPGMAGTRIYGYFCARRAGAGISMCIIIIFDGTDRRDGGSYAVVAHIMCSFQKHFLEEFQCPPDITSPVNGVVPHHRHPGKLMGPCARLQAGAGAMLVSTEHRDNGGVQIGDSGDGHGLHAIA